MFGKIPTRRTRGLLSCSEMPWYWRTHHVVWCRAHIWWGPFCQCSEIGWASQMWILFPNKCWGPQKDQTGSNGHSKKSRKSENDKADKACPCGLVTCLWRRFDTIFISGYWHLLAARAGLTWLPLVFFVYRENQENWQWGLEQFHHLPVLDGPYRFPIAFARPWLCDSVGKSG